MTHLASRNRHGARGGAAQSRKLCNNKRRIRQYVALQAQQGYGLGRSSSSVHAGRYSSRENAMSEGINHPRRRFLGTAAITVGAASGAAGAFGLFPEGRAEAGEARAIRPFRVHFPAPPLLPLPPPRA